MTPPGAAPPADAAAPLPERRTIYGLMAEFSSPPELLDALIRVRDEGYREVDAYTPFPSEQVSNIVSPKRSKVPLIVLIGGIVGCTGGYFMQAYTAGVSFPLSIGGRPLNSWP